MGDASAIFNSPGNSSFSRQLFKVKVKVASSLLYTLMPSFITFAGTSLSLVDFLDKKCKIQVQLNVLGDHFQ